MKPIALLVLAVLLLSGCAADKSVAIYSLGGSGNFSLFGSAVAGGCIIKINGEPTGLTVQYLGEDCEISYGVPDAH